MIQESAMVTISLCMIVKDEESVLARCLESVHGIADEIIIVDTGSLDKTKKIAALYTDKIYDYLWNDNFAEARNFSFSKAKNDYCMWLDADDIIGEQTKKALMRWKEQADGTADAVMIKYATGFDEMRKVTFAYYRERLVKRNRGFYWSGRVHEAIEVWGNVEYLNFYIEHHSQKEKYSTRNLLIYEKMKAEGVTFKARDMFYYARELYYHKKFEDAIENFQSFLNMENGFVENQVEACRISAYCCYELQWNKEALKFLLQGLAYRVPEAELCCDIGAYFMNQFQWEQAIFWFQAARHAQAMAQNGGFIQLEAYGYIPCIQLSVCYDKIGDKINALKYHKLAGKYKSYGKEYIKNQKYFQRIEKNIIDCCE